MPDTHCFGMFAKYWQPGNVKTRLAVEIGEEAAAEVYRSFLKTAVDHLQSLPSPRLVFSPEDREADFRELIAETPWTLVPQGDGDLGQRMHRFFERAFADGFQHVTLIGSDTPSLPRSYLHQAEALLRWHDLVLGPSADGGYYLVGARDRTPPIFQEISWSTPQVWRQTIGRLQRHGVRYAVLPTWYDVDTLSDLARLQREIATLPTFVSLHRQLHSILTTT